MEPGLVTGTVINVSSMKLVFRALLLSTIVPSATQGNPKTYHSGACGGPASDALMRWPLFSPGLLSLDPCFP